MKKYNHSTQYQILLAKLSITGLLSLYAATSSGKEYIKEKAHSTQPISITYEESEENTSNPERGFFIQIRSNNNFLINIPNTDRKVIRVYLVVDNYLESDFPESMLKDLEYSLAKIENTDQSIIIRITYDWPSDANKEGQVARPARTANTDQIIRHIGQVGPILARHPKAVAAIESGMIGLWGEQHNDIPEKNNQEFINTITNEWLTNTLNSEIPIQIRYPRVLKNYIRKNFPNTDRIGWWNDCIGAHDDTLVDSPTPNIPFGKIAVTGETCQLAARIDYSCDTMKEYLKKINIDMLHENFYKPIIDQWKSEGCFNEIASHLGYRYVIRESKFNKKKNTLNIAIENTGWGKSIKSRELSIVINGKTYNTGYDMKSLKSGDIDYIKINLATKLRDSDDIELEVTGDVKFSNKTGNRIFIKKPAPTN